MTDNEIIKALECCRDKTCKYCPNYSEDIECSEKLIKEALELIKRQQAEIERFNKSPILTKLCPMWKAEAKSEAIKEFVEEFEKRCIESGIYPAVTKNILKNLVKELTEVSNEQYKHD